MKPITQDRILKALDKSYNYVNKKPEVQIIETLAHIGINNLFSETALISDRDKLTLDYNGFSDPNQVFKRLSLCDIGNSTDNIEVLKKAWFSSFTRTLERHWKRQEKITNLQEKHGVSGLELLSVNLGSIEFQYHSLIETLNLIKSDIKILESEQNTIVRKYCNAVHKYNMTLWHQDGEDWRQMSCNRLFIKSLVQPHVSSCYERKYYTNQKELKEVGFTNLKSNLDSLDDKITWEFHLVLDNIGCSDETDKSTWFCANLGNEQPGY